MEIKPFPLWPRYKVDKSECSLAEQQHYTIAEQQLRTELEQVNELYGPFLVEISKNVYGPEPKLVLADRLDEVKQEKEFDRVLAEPLPTTES